MASSRPGKGEAPPNSKPSRGEGGGKSPGLMLDLQSPPPSQTSEAASRVRRSGTLKRNSNKQQSSEAGSGYEAGGEEAAAAAATGAAASPAQPRSGGRTTNNNNNAAQSTDSLHSRYSSSDSIFPSKGFTRSMSSSSHRSEYAAHRPFPTPGFRDRKTSRASSAKSAAGEESNAEEDMADPEMTAFKTAEEKRLQDDAVKAVHWKRWGPYLSERQWATVREDYSANGDAWTHFPHEHARSRAYRWGEDGIGGISDNHQRLCFSLALWNGQDRILKERMFGTTGHEGNHGEDVKEMYYYLDNTPTHSYMKYLYKYPQAPYPYEQLVAESQQRSREVGEYEITDTGVFDEDRYWDVFIEYAKDEHDADSMSIRITAFNRGPEKASLHIVPQLFFRNTWAWGKERPKGSAMPSMRALPSDNSSSVEIDHDTLGRYYMHVNDSPLPVGPRSRQQPVFETEGTVEPEMLYTDNDTNYERLYNVHNKTAFTKDAFHDHIIPAHRPEPPKSSERNGDGPGRDQHLAPNGQTQSDSEESGNDTPVNRADNTTPQPERQFVNPEKQGTKVGAAFLFENVPPNGGCAVVRLRLTPNKMDPASQDEELLDQNIEDRRADADEFYARFNSHALNDDLRNIMRQALSGMLWNKQFYYFVQQEWLKGDPGQPAPPPERQNIRNTEWSHLHIDNILSMPDKWEYPFFAVWDTAFHCIPLAMVDPAFAKNQLDLMTREWYMKPDGALPAYEWNFGDVNPPVHAWATFRVFKLERKMHGREDIKFLERVFQKLLLNFTWWVNRKDQHGTGIFEGGFLGMDNIGIFNRSEALPTGGRLRQSDGTSWMAFYALVMLNIALELAKHNDVYEDIASKFFEHFIMISDALTFNSGDGQQQSLWNEEDGFYYDAIDWGNGYIRQLPVRSMVGLTPLFATLTLEPGTIKRFPGFKKRMDWFLANRPEISGRTIANMNKPGKAERRLLALASEERLRRILTRMLDETEFLSKYGIRTLSQYHGEHPYSMDVNGETHSVAYWPDDSKSGMFGGNSNWRGPIWLAMVFLLIESLQRFHQYYGPEFQIECPTGSGEYMTLAGVADEIQHRIIHIVARDGNGERATNDSSDRLNHDPNFRDYVHFYEFFNGENGRGLGASHQCGWTGLLAFSIWQVGHTARLPGTPKTPRSVARDYFGESVPPTPSASDFELSEFEAELEPDEL